MFPIADERGQVKMGLGGRPLDPSGPKYLNSPESPLFSKGNVLYGLHLARGPIRRSKEVILVEGYMDVIACTKVAWRMRVAIWALPSLTNKGSSCGDKPGGPL